MPTQAKADNVAALKERLGTAKTAVLTEYRGLTVRQISDLRKQLKGAAAEYKVVKNRLARLAVKDSPLDPLAGHLKGPTGLVIAREDPVGVAKALQAFVRSNPTFAIKVGMVEGRLLEPTELRSLADLPTKEALRSQLVGALQGPMSQLAMLLTAPQRELVQVLEARSKGSSE
ncbi:MAG TPA: 50S ribosomal protein L10 [Gemmatimonadales bacterium]|nr:50S ribosomal protein L10 [Gemmatimonadales bacterium]